MRWDEMNEGHEGMNAGDEWMNACNGDESNESMNKCMTCMYVFMYVICMYV
jgi:hypothetical protein